MEIAVYIMACGILCVLICIAIDISRIAKVVEKFGKQEDSEV